MSQINVWLRSKEKLILAVICCVVIVGWFILPNVPNFFKKGQLPGGNIFGKNVPAKEIVSLSRCYYAILGGAEQYHPASIAWQMLVLNEEAKRYGIESNDADVASWLKGRFAHEDGSHDPQAYTDFLRKHGLSRTDFEKAVQTLSTGIRLQQTMTRSISLSEKEAWAWYNERGRRVKVGYVQLRANDLVPLVSIKEEELLAFYERNKNTAHSGDTPGYLQPEQVEVDYIMAPYKKYEDAAVITPEQIAAYYEANKAAKYLLPESTEDEAADVEADASGGDATDGDAETPAPACKPLAEVSAEIEKTLRSQEARRVVDDVMLKVNDEVWKAYQMRGDTSDSETIDLAAIAKRFDMDYQKTPYFSRTGIPAPLNAASTFASKAFGQSVSSIGRPKTTLTVPSGKFIFQLLDIQPPRPAALDAVRGEVEMDLRKEKALDLATEFASAARTEVDLDAAAKVVSAGVDDLLAAMPEEARRGKTPEDFYTTGESDYFDQPQYWGFTRESKTGLPGSYSYTQFARVAFTLGATGVEMAIEATGPRAVYLLERADMQQPDSEEWQKNSETLMRRLLEEKRQAVMDDWWADLRRRAKPSEEAMKFLALLPEWSGSTQ